MPAHGSRLIIGLMSGTSCDGVDAALVEIAGRGLGMKVRLIGHCHHDYPRMLRNRLLAVMAPASTTTQELCRLHAMVGEHFAAATLRLTGGQPRSARCIDLIGSHGQTICHLPPRGSGREARLNRSPVGSTLQIGDAAVIAVRTGVPVVSDFRQADIALGGQGAPLVPWTDYVLFHHRRRSRVIQNIGGIANLTYIPAGGGPKDVIAFDTGPGNMVIDEVVRRITDGRHAFDREGRRAARGEIDPALLRAWMRNPFLRRRPPKSCGREEFGTGFVDRVLGGTDIDRLGDAMIATATAFTARTIADAYRRFLPRRGGGPGVDEVILCGGGARNRTLMDLLRRQLTGIEVMRIDAFGIPDQAKEAVSFAMLAAACADRVPANLPQVTGASRPAILGRLTPT